MRPRIDSNLGISGDPDEWVHSACLLCSNGCGMDIAVKDGRIVGVRGQADHPVSFGHLGPKGEHAWVANHSKRRGVAWNPSGRHGRDHLAARPLGRRGDGGQHRAAGRRVRAVPLRPRRAVGQPAHLVRARSGQPPAAAQVVAGRGPALGFGEPEPWLLEPWLLERLAELDGRATEPFAARCFGTTTNSPAAAEG
jgi:hypothetical protein